MNAPKLKQPKEIKTGDIVIAIDEVPPYDIYINNFFIIGNNDKSNSEERNYLLLTPENGEVIEINNTIYWT